MPHQEIPWKQIYDLSLQCCKYRSTKSFSVSLLREMNRLVPFDEAVVFYLNGNLKITDYYLYNINPKWMSLYLGYYSNADRGANEMVTAGNGRGNAGSRSVSRRIWVRSFYAAVGRTGS